MRSNNQDKKVIKKGDTVSIRFSKNVSESVMEWVNKQTSITNSILKLIEKEVKENGIKDLSKKSPLPTEKELMPYVFDCVAKNDHTTDGASVQDIYNHCARKLNVSPSQRAEPSKANKSKFENRVRFAILELKNKGLIEPGSKRGHYKLTKLGRHFYNSGIDILDFEDIVEAILLNKKIQKSHS